MLLSHPLSPSSKAALFFSYSGLFGGSERILIDRASRLDKRALICCPAGPLGTRARAEGLLVRPLADRSVLVKGSLGTRARAVASLWQFARELRAITRELSPEVLVLWGMRPALIGSGLQRPHPPLVFVHNDLLPGGALVDGAIRRAARRCDAVAVLSDAIAAELHGISCDSIPAGVDLAKVTPQPPSGGRNVLLLGAIVKWKRPDLALEVIARAARALPDLTLTVAGTPIEGDPEGIRLLARLRQRAAAADLAGRVTFVGQLADSLPALRAASCVLHCSDAEPFGLALVEALAAGRPVVAPSAGGVPEIVDASCGRLYPPGNAHAGAAALVHVLEDQDRTRALGVAARQRAEARFDVDEIARRFRALLDRVCA